jgi:hypothetical protein
LIDEDHYIEPHVILDKWGGGVDGLDTMANTLEAIASDVEARTPNLDGAIESMRAAGGRMKHLADAIAAVRDAFEATAGALNPLPEKPLPWPGALRPDIDYTAEDFPLRYQPPPGFDWCNVAERGVAYQDAEAVDATSIKGSKIIIDHKGRVSWLNRDDDALAEGRRWPVWHLKRDDIPYARGFDGGTPPRAIDSFGNIIPEPHTEGTEFGEAGANWKTERDYETAKTQLSQIIGNAVIWPQQNAEQGGEFAPPAEVAI